MGCFIGVAWSVDVVLGRSQPDRAEPRRRAARAATTSERRAGVESAGPFEWIDASRDRMKLALQNNSSGASAPSPLAFPVPCRAVGAATPVPLAVWITRRVALRRF